MYYSFGNRAQYKIADGSSVGVYANKSSNNVKKKQIIEDTAAEYEKKCCFILHTGIKMYLSTSGFRKSPSKYSDFIKILVPVRTCLGVSRFPKPIRIFW